MKRLINRIPWIVAVLLMVSASEDFSHKLIIIGDSTASIYDDSLFPRIGWGQILQAFLKSEDITVIDKALSGRSSKSYFTDPDGWVTVLNNLTEGDYLFIQFGHNDQKDDDRHTDPYTTYQEYLSIYIDSTRARGAYPVLLTPIHRNYWNGDIINDSHGDYPPAMRALAEEKEVPLIDLHAKTKALFEQLGPEFTTSEIFMNLPEGIWIYYPDGNLDNTHFQENGAFEICKLIIGGISELTAQPEMALLQDAIVPAGRVIAMPSPDLSGIIRGMGVYSVGQELILTAADRPGYTFLSWTENDTLYSDKNSINLVLDDSLRELVANYGVVFNVTLKQLPGFYGILEGHGYYLPGEEVTIIATPKEGYMFNNWQKDDVVITTDSMYTFIMEEENVIYTATFEEFLGSTEIDDFEDVRVYPNPNNGNFRITGIDHDSYVEIFSPQGELVFISVASDNQQDLKMDLKKGIYLIRIKYHEKIMVFKLVVE